MTVKGIEPPGFIRGQYRVRGSRNVLLVWRILKTVKGYSRLTVRQLFYVLVSRFPRSYPATIAFYKRLDRYLVKIRRVSLEVHKKFIDSTRQFITPPLPYPRKEIWVEKDSIRNFIGELAAKYRLSIQVLRGFASLSMYRKALERARKRRVNLLLYIGDFDPSGLLIEKVAEEEMDHNLGIRFARLALTMPQISRLKPPSRPVNRKDSRVKEYTEKYGNRCWEVEAIRPRTLYRLIEQRLKEAIPPEFLAEARSRENAVRLVRPITEYLRKTIEREAFSLLKSGVSQEEIFTRISDKYKLGAQKQKR